MNTLAKVGIIGLVGCAALYAIPALKGPYNRVKNNVTETLNDEFVVDNYKSMYIDLYNKRIECKKSIAKFNIEMKVIGRKHDYVLKQSEIIKNQMKSFDTSNVEGFMKLKALYETSVNEANNYQSMYEAYSNALTKLESSLKVIETNMVKAKSNVATLESKKECVDTLKAVNTIVENIQCVGDSELATSVEKLNDDELRETIKLEAMATEAQEPMTEADIKIYINSLN